MPGGDAARKAVDAVHACVGPSHSNLFRRSERRSSEAGQNRLSLVQRCSARGRRSHARAVETSASIERGAGIGDAEMQRNAAPHETVGRLIHMPALPRSRAEENSDRSRRNTLTPPVHHSGPRGKPNGASVAVVEPACRSPDPPIPRYGPSCHRDRRRCSRSRPRGTPIAPRFSRK